MAVARFYRSHIPRDKSSPLSPLRMAPVHLVGRSGGGVLTTTMGEAGARRGETDAERVERASSMSATRPDPGSGRVLRGLRYLFWLRRTQPGLAEARRAIGLAYPLPSPLRRLWK